MTTQTVRNVVIVLALAAGVMLIPGGGNASDAIVQTLTIVMFTALSYFAVRMYRERRTDLYSLGDRNRTILYASVGLAVFLFVAARRMWDAGGVGVIGWFLLLGAAIYGVYHVFRVARDY